MSDDDGALTPALRVMREAARLPVPTDDQRAASRKRGEALASSGRASIAARVGVVALAHQFSNDDEAVGFFGQVAADLAHELAPRSTAERMIVEQLLAIHAQLMNAHLLMGNARTWEETERLGMMASRLSADFRKTLLALKEWRAPARQTIVAQQANVAHQQVVNQVHGTPTNELGTKLAQA